MSDIYGIITSTYSLLFLAIVGSFTYIFINSLGKAVDLIFDIRDLSINMGFYFVLVSFNLLQKTYLENESLTNILETLIDVGVWTNCVLPVIYFILTIAIGTYLSKRVKGVNYG